MDAILYFTLTLSYLILFIMGIIVAKRFHWKAEIVLLIMIAALLYDNGILAAGKYIGESAALKTLHAARYWLHAFFTPLLIIYSWRLLTAANFDWAANKKAGWIAAAVTAAVICLEIMFETWGLSLKPAWKHGVLLYENAEKTSSFPVMMIVVSIVLTAAALLLWLKRKQPHLTIGIVLAAGVGYLIHFIIDTETSHNFSELILIISLIMARYKLHRQAEACRSSS